MAELCYTVNYDINNFQAICPAIFQKRLPLFRVRRGEFGVWVSGKEIAHCRGDGDGWEDDDRAVRRGDSRGSGKEGCGCVNDQFSYRGT